MLMVYGCSTRKNTFTRRVYHNTTAHYNVYWNGMDNMRQALKEFEQSTKDNYALVLPVYNFGDRSSIGKMSQYADISIKKANKTIQKHSMHFNKKEYVRWIDDAYMLIGKSYFYKQDYPMARRTFEFVVKTYNDNEIKYEAMLWMALSNIQMADFSRAEPLLDMLQSKISKGEAPERLETDLNLTYGQFYILQTNYNAAVPYLLRALELKPDHSMRTRCMFILGQIYQRNDDLKEAYAQYKAVLKRGPSYDMEFNARICLAQCYDVSSGDREGILKKLKRMLRDDKNKDFVDQIYYALAEVSLREADTSAAITYLKKSVAGSVSNNYQKAISALRLADLYFEIPEYNYAQQYYDSCMQFLPKDFPGYSELSKRTNTLTDLVKNLQIIQREDSLQKLAGMPEDQRIRVVDGIIGRLIAEEVRKKQEEQEKRDNANLFPINRDVQQSVGSKEARWYFYNPTALSNGFSNFIRRWGRRKLEDNWFLSDKTITTFASSSDITDSVMTGPGDTLRSGKQAATSTNPKDRTFYLQNIPTTPELIVASNNKIIQAYYNSAFIYSEELNDLGNSVKSFETLLERFPENKYKIQAHYMLYLQYGKMKNIGQADNHRNIILSQYSESDYAKLLVNPNYYKEILENESQAAKLYEETYRAFQNQQFYMVLNNSEQARSQFKNDSILMPKFDYLRALALGKIEIIDSLVVALYKITRDYPKSEVKKLAEQVLASLSNQRNSQGQPIIKDTTSVLPPEQNLYSYQPGSVHFYVLVVNGNLVDVTALKIKIADFNAKYFDLEGLQVNSVLFDNNREMITVNNFDNADKAVNYLINIRESKYIFTKLENAGEYADFVISVENYPILYRHKDIALYTRFFSNSYDLKK